MKQLQYLRRRLAFSRVLKEQKVKQKQTNKQTNHPSAETSTYIWGGIFSSTDNFGTSPTALEVSWILCLVQDWNLRWEAMAVGVLPVLAWEKKKADICTFCEAMVVCLRGKNLFSRIIWFNPSQKWRIFCVFVLIRGSAVLLYPITQRCHGRWFFGP